jgi:CRISPR system Cascade subunit CasE
MKKMMFASVLNLDRKAVKHLKIKDPYAIHRVVYSLFDDVRSSDEKKTGARGSGIVYADQGGTYHGRQILMVSDRMPASHVEGCYGSVETKEIAPAFLDYEAYRFKVIMNPCIRDNKTRRLVPIKTREAIMQWFMDKSAQNWGFLAETRHLQVNKIEVLQFKAKDQNLITLSKATLEGVLQVVDKQKFSTAFQQGIGRGRAFGCGLLQIVPQSNNLF